jgi:DNA-directed RNA polymerase specialized sigma24 family protein
MLWSAAIHRRFGFFLLPEKAKGKAVMNHRTPKDSPRKRTHTRREERVNGDSDFGSPTAFPATRCSVVRATADADPAVRRKAFEALISAYWKPVYKHLRIRWGLHSADAQDTAQAFFARALEKDFFTRYDPGRARFRTFLRTCVDGFAANERRAAGRQKRGGDVVFHALDFAAADGELHAHPPAVGTDPDELFRREWVRSLFGLAVADLERWCTNSGRNTHFALFRRYDLEGPDGPERPTYAQLAAEFALSASQVTNHLAAVRRQFRALVLERLRATTGSEEEFYEESRRLFGGDAP